MLPFTTVRICGVDMKGLVDTGCQQTVILTQVCVQVKCVPKGPGRLVKMLNGESTRCSGEAVVDVEVNGSRMKVRCLVAPELVCEAEIILGMDVISRLGGVFVNSEGEAQFGGRQCAVGAVQIDKWIEIDETDFTANFDGVKWTVEWKWEKGEPELTNTCHGYAVSEDCKDQFEEEVDQWIHDGWLEPYDPEIHGATTGVIPLMAVKQPNKSRKVRPVMDYRELNSHIKSYPGLDTAVCQDKLREWRLRGSNAAMLDLKKAYLQVHVSDRLKRFQIVKHKGRQYVMTRMGFGLNVAPKIMSKILSRVLSVNKQLSTGTDHYIDDIYVDESVVTAEDVKSHLLTYGLISKDPVPLDNTRVLGLRVVKDDHGVFRWSRDGDIPVLSDKPTKRELFSVCGKLIGHYPVAGWLRMACSYVKRRANDIPWDESLPAEVLAMVKEIFERVSKEDPVRGTWSVDSANKGEVWCDASSLAVGCCLTVNNQVVEDAAWLRKEDDGAHINVAELEAVVKGLNLALKWGRTELKVITDSASVYNWVSSILEDSRRPKVSGLSEMIIKRRLGTIAQLIQEYKINMTIELVPSASNISDPLTRVPQRWLRSVCLALQTITSDREVEVQMIHNKTHLGVNRTLYLARRLFGDDVERKTVERVVSACGICRKIDPSPVKWDHGQLSVGTVWQRLAVDITYVNKKAYLSLIDCGPSRFTIWTSLVNETADQIIKHLQHVFLERGAPEELLSDNGPCFISSKTASFLQAWGVSHVLSCAHKHSGNGIVERNHRTIKRMVARTGGRVEDMVYWYNNTPNSENIVPAEVLYMYSARLKGEDKQHDNTGTRRAADSNPYHVGDPVYVKPANARCDIVWKTAMVSKVVADQVVEVNGVNRHVSDVRPADGEQMQMVCNTAEPNVDILYDNVATDGLDEGLNPVGDDEQSDVDSTGGDEVRDRRPPRWLADFYTF